MSTIVSSLEAVFSADTSSLTSGLSQADSAITGFGNKLQSIGGKISAFGAQLGAVAAPAVMAFSIAATSAMGFNESMTNANSILQLSEEQIGAVSNEILAMGTDAIAGPQAVADSYYDIVSGVADASTHMDILSTSIAVSEAGASDLKATTSALVGTMNAYGFAAEDAAFAGDVFTRITGMGVGTLDEFGAALPRVTGLASSLGIGFDDLGAQMAFVTTKGYSAGQAATMLQASMTSLINPNETMIKVFDELGVANGEALIQMYGLDGALGMVADSSIATQEGLAKTLGSTEALNGALVLTQDGAQGFFDTFSGGSIELHNAMEDLNTVAANLDSPLLEGRVNPALIGAMTDEINYAASATESYTDAARKVQRASPAAQFKLMKAQVAGLAIEVGTALFPAMVNLFDSIRPVLTSVIGWVKENPELVSQIGMVAFGAAALASVLVPMGMVIGVVGTALTGIGFVLGLLLSPIGLVVGALALLALAYTTNFMGIQTTLAPAMDWLKGAFTDAVGWVGDLVNAFQEGGLGGAADFVTEQIAGLATSILNTDWGGVWNNIKAKGGELWENFKTGLALGSDFILSNIVTPFVVAIAATDWQGVWDQMTQMAGMLWENFKTGLTLTTDFVLVNVINPLATQVSGFVSSGGLYDAVYSLGTAFWNGLLLGVQSIAWANTFVMDHIVTPLAEQALTFVTSGGLWDAIQAIGNGIWDGLKLAMQTHEGIMTFISDNLIAPLLQSALDSDWSGVVNSAIEGANQILTGIGDTLTGGAAGLWADFKNALNDLIPNNINFGTTIDLGAFGSKSIGASFNLPDNPFKSGTAWTGSMGRDEPAGVVHGKEGVVPTGGMLAKVVPSPDGLMVHTRGGGGGGGVVINGDVLVYGVQDVASLYEQLQKEGKRKSGAAGVW